MLKFYHNEIKKIEELIRKLNIIFNKYNDKDIDTCQTFLNVMDECIKEYKELGKIERESQLLSIKAEVITAQKGINPLTFEKQTLRRNELVNTFLFKALKETENIFRNDLVVDESKIVSARELISQIIIAAIQSEMIKNQDIQDLNSFESSQRLWILISKDSNISLGQQRALLTVNKSDADIIFFDLLTSLKKQV